jgi:hypothetical protein
MAEPEVSLREITADTVREICRLRVAPGQEGFVAPVAESMVAESIAEAYDSQGRGDGRPGSTASSASS